MSTAVTFALNNQDQLTLQRLSGPLGANFDALSKSLNVEIRRAAEELLIKGDDAEVGLACLQQLLSLAQQRELTDTDIQLAVVAAKAQQVSEQVQHEFREREREQPYDEKQQYSFRTRRGNLTGRTPRQNGYIKALHNHDVVFGLGPAGTGKTYLAVAAAVDAVERHLVDRIVLVRPAVEAGEKLGFLPGDLAQKVDPYLRPLYDALYDLMGFDRVSKLLEKGLIEIAPLAYMRGRTLNSAYVILDEAQNTTPEQMKMFLTRLGFGSRAVITGDITQVDLPRGQQSGLAHALRIIDKIKEIHITRFHSRDVVRHQLVQKIVEAYEGWDAEQHRLTAEARAERKARQEALVAENDAAADAQH